MSEDSALAAVLLPLSLSQNPSPHGGWPRLDVDLEFINTLHMGASAIQATLLVAYHHYPITPFSSDPLPHPLPPPSTQTIHRKILEAGLHTNDQPTIEYATISDQDLNQEIIRLTTRQPKVGAIYLHGALTSLGIYLPRDLVRAKVAQLRPARHYLAENLFPTRNMYSVAGPNSVWHHDGQHKLIDFGIVVHGFIDGYSRLITGVRAVTNNRGDTVLDLFKDAIAVYGLRSRAHGDRGGENVEVAIFVTRMRGVGMGSYLWGE